ncbi:MULTISPECIES: LacI family DNA-binding transcriptional regulator [unclassified Chelatococcus]|uniref:LacI family DNA-binding transcriptional regulator n=1 Tax=unclassified Chelatococcus TaxID=2638111 RepID=UPI001BCFD26B|nr:MULTISPECIES: LacI family DNA-binding transcriptional regulator [unclassified Chelatococcus]MBS7697431.1 LacI family DNA-binding transcriptional regulator [Chelatococcus sp. YT9]MBX3559258.1 LacI family DNA-binding transcriptional regulator [Chelatococcus sp.]
MPEEVSLATVAARAGVSVSTVSRIVNGETRRASAATVARVRDAIEAVGYRPNPVGRALRRRESQVVGMLVANLDNPAMATIASSTEAALRSAGYVMMLCDTHDRADLQDDYLRALRAQLVRGFVMVASVPSKGLAELSAAGAPMVFVTRRAPSGLSPFVGIDDRGAGAAVADRFIDDGRRAPAVAFPRHGSSATRDRVAGFLDRLAERGRPAASVIQGDGAGLSHLQVGYEAAEQIFSAEEMPDAILCVSDQIAYGVRRRALERGLDVPRDCSLVSIDGSPLNKWVAPWLVSVEIPYTAYGQEVLASLEDIWSDVPARDRLLPYRF